MGKQLIKGSVQRMLWLWQAKHNQRLTGRELAKRAGLAYATVDRYVNDRVFQPNDDTVAKLCEVLECEESDLIEIVGDEVNKQRPSSPSKWIKTVAARYLAAPVQQDV